MQSAEQVSRKRELEQKKTLNPDEQIEYFNLLSLDDIVEHEDQPTQEDDQEPAHENSNSNSDQEDMDIEENFDEEPAENDVDEHFIAKSGINRFNY